MSNIRFKEKLLNSCMKWDVEVSLLKRRRKMGWWWETLKYLISSKCGEEVFKVPYPVTDNTLFLKDAYDFGYDYHSNQSEHHDQKGELLISFKK